MQLLSRTVINVLDLVTFTEEILNENRHLLYSDGYIIHITFNEKFHQILCFATSKTERPIFQNWVT